MKKTHVRVELLNRGFSIKINQKKFPFLYPPKKWQALPNSLKIKFSETAAYFFTLHLTLSQNKPLYYYFPPPLLHSLFFHGYLYAVVSANVEIPNSGLNPLTILKQLFNLSYQSEFNSFSSFVKTKEQFIVNNKVATIPFTFGKDSLLTFALNKELGLQSELVYFAEPTSTIETKNKKILAGKFLKEFNTRVQFVENTLGHLRQKNRLMWGWDMLVTQYTLMLVPYLWNNRSQYLFWSHEQSVNNGDGIDQGFYINVSHEQTSQWMLHLNNILHEFSIKTHLGSILEPLQEISIMYILHKRYSSIGKYQHSCLGDKKSNFNSRWCGNCYECVRVYLFLLAIGVDPKTVGFRQNLMNSSKRKHFLIFEEKELQQKEKTFDHYSERMLAFYLAYQRGFRGGVIDLFEKYYLSLAKLNLKKLADYYTKQFSGLTVPKELSKLIIGIYSKEQATFYKEIMQAR